MSEVREKHKKYRRKIDEYYQDALRHITELEQQNRNCAKALTLSMIEERKLKQQNRGLRESLKQCMTWLKKESKSMPNYDITQSVLWQSFEEILKQEERDEL